MSNKINKAIDDIAKEHNIFVQNHNIFKIDYKSKIIQIHVFFNKSLE